MMNVDINKLKTKVTHTQTSPDGSVVVITDVPAYVFEEDGIEQTVYDMDVALKIDEFVAERFEENLQKRHALMYSYEQISSGLKIDVQIKIEGDGNEVTLGGATTKTWKESFDNLQGGLSILWNAVASVFKGTKITYPNVGTVGSGSLVFGLQAKSADSVKQDLLLNPVEPPIEIRVLQLLIDGYAYALDGEVTNPLILEHAEIAVATVKAIERLSPKGKSEIKTVQIIPNSNTIERHQSVSLTRNTYKSAQTKRKWLEAGSDEADIREIWLTGQVAALSRDGNFTIRDIEESYPDDKRYPTRAIFHENIFEKLTDLFKQKKRVKFTGIEYRINNKWTSQPVIKHVEEAPPKTGDTPPPLITPS
jgi:hypothetical protein